MLPLTLTLDKIMVLDLLTTQLLVTIALIDL